MLQAVIALRPLRVSWDERNTLCPRLPRLPRLPRCAPGAPGAPHGPHGPHAAPGSQLRQLRQRRQLRLVSLGLVAMRTRKGLRCGADDLPHYFPKAIHFKEDDSLDEDDEDLASEEICELIGYDLGEGLSSEISEPFTAAALKEAYEASGFFSARKASQKAAMWLIGPSACGKSTLASKAATWAGMDAEGYVTIDGEAFRDAHQGYQKAIAAGHQNGCVWWNAYLGIRENINEEKQQLLDKAKRDGKNLMIPSTCLRRSQCVDVAEDLVRSGYQIHVVGVFGDKATIIERGHKRASTIGKRYDPREFELALKMFAPMLRLCTGMWRMVCTTGMKVPELAGRAPLREDDVEKICRNVFAMYESKEDVCS